MDLVLSKLQSLICHKTNTYKQPTKKESLLKNVTLECYRQVVKGNYSILYMNINKKMSMSEKTWNYI